jgi:bifunctional UDP-N-acetylglucosamine pyrophosphorylase/glucosamine-1-phosphate N-acetyltransferase
MILAAGLGTRMKSARAKVLHCLGGRPLIRHVLDAVRALAPERLVVVVGHQAREVEAACAPVNGHGDSALRFVLQAEQRGTGHAVRCAAPALDGFSGDVLIVYGDTPALRAETLAALVAGHQRARATVSLLTACFQDPTGYGRILRDESGAIARIVEERDATPTERRVREINPGIYCVAADFLRTAVGALATNNAQGEYYLTDIVSMARAGGHATWTNPVDDAAEVSGINTRAELAGMEAKAREAAVQQWMAAGVTFEDPATAYIGADVRIGRDTVIGPNTTLRGATVIGEGCRIDGSAYLNGARLGDRVHLKFGTVITDSTVGDDAEIGPFAHLRPGTALAEGVHIGNFVETKKAVVGRRTKANHLSYLGDVTIGEATNVGAGTITCNYDGFRKHPTVIGDRVQIGSDTQLVAPVRVGSDAYVGAGTTVTQDVDAGALVVSRVPQRQVAGWVAQRRLREQQGQPSREHAAPAERARVPKRDAARDGSTGSAPREARAGKPAPRQGRDRRTSASARGRVAGSSRQKHKRR